MNKFVAVVDRNYAMPLVLNAIGHLALGLGCKINSAAKFSTFSDVNGIDVSYLTDYPLIILGAKSNEKLQSIHEQAICNSIIHNVYYETMFSNSVEHQLQDVASAEYNAQKYIAILLFGDAELLGKITKRVSLLKA